MKFLFFIFVITVINATPVDDDGRRSYVMGFKNPCKSYVKTFKCMTGCKGMDYQVFRLDFKCRCTCHEMRTTKFLPYFMQKTNGTTKKLPSTHGPLFYDIAGKMKDEESTESTTIHSTPFTCPTFGGSPSNSPSGNTGAPSTPGGGDGGGDEGNSAGPPSTSSSNEGTTAAA